MDLNELRVKTLFSLFWKFAERFGVSGIQFILQIILARLLMPADYGILSIMIIFTNLANVFIQNGFNTALIQKKDTSNEDYSSVFWLTFTISIFIYIFLFFSAPFIADFYNMEKIIFPFRIISLMVIPGALNSIQIAIISKKMDFKKIFTSNLFSILFSGIIGIFLAYKGLGIWALVFQTLSNVFIACIVMWFTVKWRPLFVFEIHRVKKLFTYGWKLLTSSLLDTLYQELSSLVIGKKYDSSTLGFYNRGKQFPQFLINAINGSVQSVMLPAMSTIQDNKLQVKAMMRRSIILSSYIIFPMMVGLAVVADPLVKLLLTEKWSFCVPYMQIFCFTYAFYPVHSCNLQTINAIGRSDIFLKLEIIKKTIGIISLIIAVFCFDSPIAIAMTGIFTTFTSCFINAYPNKILINYSYIEQMKDILPNFIIACLMGIVVYPIIFLKFNIILTIVLQIILGVIVYIIISLVLKIESFSYILTLLKKIINRNNGREKS
ncbi:lipopolysaccharide biosynthesis protein [Clostridium sp. C1]|uniref:lipopolysaccharide biosynthesis protein n=1 Tax=Clostridium sp. C1 TaxID=1155388 RepID=UPI001BAD3942|nr:lipopolysaccharide biosynthesis protein [Clostridium sp. C1]QUN12891.1 lipopolysaccharide biosynthesis protein [Clostridium sp. C1]